MMIQFLQQLNGQNFYYYYGPVFFQAANTGLGPLTIQLILGAVSFIMAFPSIWTIEHVGRRKSLLIGAALQGTFALIAGLCGHFFTNRAGLSDSTKVMGGNILIAFAVLHISGFSIFWGPTPWVGAYIIQKIGAKGVGN